MIAHEILLAIEIQNSTARELSNELKEIKSEIESLSRPDIIAKKAKALGTNARGLKNILDSIILPYQFDAAEMRSNGVNKIQITGDVVDKGDDPVLLFKKPDAKKQQAK